ncbi:ABC transporter permease [Pseudophaeobacter leonis]|uniref:ABC transporter permease n=1 Tax=Pseudophaeobacter leonis TaxID=1144477 RepID=UPI0009F227D5|nr:ABC transporter permease [Pseudophaeobacter leonis]
MNLIGRLSQEQIVFGLAVLLCLAFTIFVPGFLTTNNLVILVRSVSILGILGVAMGIVVIGRGIDLSLVAVMAISVAWSLQLVSGGMPLAQALIFGLAFSILIGVINGVFIAYVEVPAIFATLAMGTAIYGFGRYFLFDLDVIYFTSDADSLLWLGEGTVLGLPAPIIMFIGVCIAAHLFLKFTKNGSFLRAVGDNAAAARITGVPVRPIIILQYMISASIGFLAGCVTAASVASMNTRVAHSTFVYDVILVVVLGGIGLSGGRGGVRNVVVGTLLIGVLINGMTILNIQYTVQNVIKGVILLLAIVIDTLLNPRDEQTAQQGDI